MHISQFQSVLSDVDACHRQATLGSMVDLLNWLLPRSCLLCDTECTARARRQTCARRQTHVDLCETCRPGLPWNRHCCERCAMPTGSAGDCTVCSAFAFSQAVAPLRLEGEISSLIHRMKFAGGFSEARVLADLLSDAVASRYHKSPLPDSIVPVPLSTRRLVRRGYNQAVLLAVPLARATGIPLLRSGFTRLHRPRQLKLSARDRATNLDHTMATTRRLRGTVAIVDDVLTTGATANELARVLRHAGADDVHLWCVARAS